MSRLFVALALLLAAYIPIVGPAVAAGEDGSISITIKEYERLKDLEEGDKKKQYWKMTFEQILEKENNNYSAAVEKYNFWVGREIVLDETVTDSAVDAVIRGITTLNHIGSTPITLILDSPGGSVLAGYRLANAMARSVSPVYTVCDGWAMSMAAVLFAIGDYREANEGCIWMIHEVAAGSPGGQTTDQLSWADHIIDVEDILLNMMSRRTGLSVDELRVLGEYETFYQGDELSRLGVADVAFANLNGGEERDIPDDLLPVNRLKANVARKLAPRE